MHLLFNFDACPMHSPFGFVHLTHQNLSARALFCLNSLAKVNTQLLIYNYRWTSFSLFLIIYYSRGYYHKALSALWHNSGDWINRLISFLLTYRLTVKLFTLFVESGLGQHAVGFLKSCLGILSRLVLSGPSACFHLEQSVIQTKKQTNNLISPISQLSLKKAVFLNSSMRKRIA